MEKYHLSRKKLNELKAEHRQTFDKRCADRLKAVFLLGSGWTTGQVAEALLIDGQTVRNHYKRYQEGGVVALIHMEMGGSEPRLSEAQLAELDQHLVEVLHLTVKEVIRAVEQRWGVRYSERGMTHLLHRLGYVYKKPILVPGKADAEAQDAFVETYQKLKQTKEKDDPLYFMDATHPHHNPVLAYGWIKRGDDYAIRSNTGRQRLNINGAVDIATLIPVIRYDDTINAVSTIELFKQIEVLHPTASVIYVICDNARYYRSRMVREYLEDSKIELIFLPPYSPNLNLIERYWKFFKKKVLYDRYYPTFDEFKEACSDFFKKPTSHVDELRSLLAENFQIISV